MRVELPQSPPRSEAPNDPAPPLTSNARVRRRSRYERWALALTAKRVSIPIVAFSATLLAWALLIREPQGRKALVVMARSTPPQQHTNAIVTAESIAALKAQYASRSTALIRHRKEIPPILSQLELRAAELGWFCERALKPPVSEPFGLTNLTLHPVAMHLMAEGTHTTPPFHRFAEWLREVSSLPKRCEVTQLSLRANPAGLGTVDLTLHFYSSNEHAETSPK